MSLWSEMQADVSRRLGRQRVSLVQVLATASQEVGLRAIIMHRVSSHLAEAHVPWLPSILRQGNLTLHGLDIVQGARIGAGVQIPHPDGVVIGEGAVVEDAVLIHSGVVLGLRLAGDGRPDGYPTIGEGAILGAGAKILGPVYVGAGARVGANSVVTRDVAAGSVVAGIPARPIGDRGSSSRESTEPRGDSRT